MKPISHITADSQYSVFHFTDGTKEMVCKTLKTFEKEGIRIHRKVVVNPDQMRQIMNYHPVYLVQMQDLSIHRIARRRVKTFLEYTENRRRAIISERVSTPSNSMNNIHDLSE